MSKISKCISAITFVLVIGSCAWLACNRQLVLDQVRIWQYKPMPDITRLAERIGMTEQARQIFYRTHPQLESADTFNQHCHRIEQASPIVGCYVQGRDAMYIYNVPGTELDGIKEVTAAHEMLHAAWGRYSEVERARLGSLLDAVYQRLNDAKLTERMKYYDRAQPGSRTNELHSILGTEYTQLGPELEAHFAQYFSDRQALVKLHESYSHRFEAAQAEAESLAKQLETRKPKIEQLVRQYTSAVAQYNQQVETFNQRAASGNFLSQAEFASEHADLAKRGEQLKTQSETIRSQIAMYNADTEKLQLLGRNIDRLNQTLDSQRVVK